MIKNKNKLVSRSGTTATHLLNSNFTFLPTFMSNNDVLPALLETLFVYFTRSLPSVTDTCSEPSNYHLCLCTH